MLATIWKWWEQRPFRRQIRKPFAIIVKPLRKSGVVFLLLKEHPQLAKPDVDDCSDRVDGIHRDGEICDVWMTIQPEAQVYDHVIVVARICAATIVCFIFEKIPI